MQCEGLLKGDFLRFFLGQTPVDEKLMDQCVDEADTNGVLLTGVRFGSFQTTVPF